MSPHDDDRDDFLDTINKMLAAKTVKTTVIYKFSHVVDTGGGIAPGGGGGFGGGLGVGDIVGGGGVVTSVTGSRVTVNFPQGVPNAPINMPGVDTTVIVESSGSSEASPTGLGMAPWGEIDDDVFAPPGGEFPEIVPDTDALHTNYKLSCPGGKTSHVRMSATLIFNPTNLSTCDCAALYISSLGQDNKPIRGVDGQVKSLILMPGQSTPEYHAELGAVAILVACNAACTGCEARFRIDNAVI